MGSASKRSRPAQNKSDSEEDNYMETGKLALSVNKNFYEDEDEEEEEEDEEKEENDNEDEEEEQDEEGDDVEQNNGPKDDEMEELEKEYMDLRNQEQDILNNLKRYKDEDLLKGQAVKNQKALWDKTLEFRFLLQKAFSSSNRLPQESLRSSFCNLDEGVSAAYSELVASSDKTLDSLLELQEALLEKNPSITEATNGNSKQNSQGSEAFRNEGMELDKEWLRISQMHSRIASFRDKSVDKWQRKTQVTTGAAAIKGKLHAFNQNISEQVAAYMRDPSRMIKSMQQRRSMVGVFGAVPDVVTNSKEEETRVDGDPELLDDAEFYQQLLKEFFETIDPTSSETAFYALKRLQTKKRKIVDRRASKSRKIRYHVHDKIVNFMAPQPMQLPPMAPLLFENLFGLRTQKPASLIQ
ncbi:uncharacterized protein LOC131166389 [Malania oleifera]|uniref:uncharacterized protein LOC131166389 n=1 Tax=Malania oleifera TaxID=397392 RepID=UPI0025ADEBC7|nr:uncharacterized protein LOC131166389 [Malania oleifera]